MGTEGFNLVTEGRDRSWENYEDLASLKKWLWANSDKGSNRLYDRDNIYLIRSHLTQTSTGSEAELESTDSIAIAQKGKTELTLVIKSDTDDNAYDGETVTIYYVDHDGVSHTSSAAYNTTNATTEAAFDPAVTDFYDWDYSYENPVVSSVAVQAGDNVFVGVTGLDGTLSTNTYAVIAATNTSPTAANYVGVGTIYGRSHTSHADADGAKIYVTYFTPWGDFVRNALITLDTAAGDGTDTEELLYITDSVTYVNGTVASSTYTAGNVWYIVDLWTDTTPTSNSHEFLLSDEALANVDGSGGDCYGVIKEGEYVSTFTRFRVPYGYDGWIAYHDFDAPAVSAAGDDLEFKFYFFPDGESIRRIHSRNFREENMEDGLVKPVKLEEEKDAYITIADIGGAMECAYEAIYILAKRNTIS